MIDKMRVRAVQELKAQGYKFVNGNWIKNNTSNIEECEIDRYRLFYQEVVYYFESLHYNNQLSSNKTIYDKIKEIANKHKVW